MKNEKSNSVNQEFKENALLEGVVKMKLSRFCMRTKIVLMNLKTQ